MTRHCRMISSGLSMYIHVKTREKDGRIRLFTTFAKLSLERRDAATFGNKLLISGQRSQNLSLPQREKNLWVVLGVGDDEVLNLKVVRTCVRAEKMRQCWYLITLKHRISLLSLRLAPNLEELLDSPFANLVGTLTGLGPVKGRAKGSV